MGINKKFLGTVLLKCILGYSVLFFIFSCQTTKKTTPEETLSNSPKSALENEKTSSWPNQMQELTHHLSKLLPILTDPKSYKDQENKKLFETRIIELKRIAHNMNENTPAPDQDPSLRLIGKRFEDNLKLSLESFETGHVEFSQTVFKNALAQCVQCHTRSDLGPTLAEPQFVSSLEKVPPVEKVQFLIASRYFDQAMKEITTALKEGQTLSAVNWQKLIQMGLIINVRFRHDVNETQNFLKFLSTNKHLPFFIKRQLPYWEQSTKNWSQKPQSSPNLKVAQQIVARANGAQKSSRSEGGTIDYLRAGSLLHQFLAHSQASSDKSEALYQLGLIYENLGEIGAWSMNEDYFELCIRTQPHSPTAKKCFERFKASTITGFSGTSGVNIPPDVQKRMTELETMAL